MIDAVGVDGAFINTFVFAIQPYDADRRHDLDACGASLVRPLTGGQPRADLP